MTPWVTRLLVANVAVFFLQVMIPGVTPFLTFYPAYVWQAPWTIVTYMFAHGGLGHIFFNMLALYFFGPRVEDRLGSRRFITMYLLSGLAGAALSMVMAPRSGIVGASAAIFGVMLAFAWYWPRERILIWGILPVEARVLVVVTTLLALYSGLQGSRGGMADFAHLGGYAGAFLYLKFLERNTGARQFQRRAEPRVADRSLVNWKKVDPARVHEVNRDELNRILDKINRTGLGSLTGQEKAFLSSFVPPDDRVPPVS